MRKRYAVPAKAVAAPAKVAFTGAVHALHLLRQVRVDLPVGSEEATRFYAACALEAGVAFINNIPVFIASDPSWAQKFKERKLPVIGDDIKAQLGATVVQRALVELFKKRGVKLERSYQLNTGGNTDFLNMLNRERLQSKKISKTEAVQSVAACRIPDRDIHIGPCDYVPWQKDRKVCFLRMEGLIFGNIPVDLELRLNVEDSPNAAGIAIDAVRCCKLALDRGIGSLFAGRFLLQTSASAISRPPGVADDRGFYYRQKGRLDRRRVHLRLSSISANLEFHVIAHDVHR